MNQRQLLSTKLKQHRKALGLTQEHVAQALHVDRSTYAYYELGRTSPSHETMSKFADLYGVTLDSLVGRRTDEGIDHRAPIEDFRFLRRSEQALLLRYRQLSDDARDDVFEYVDEKLSKHKK